MSREKINEVGNVYGKLTVIKYAYTKNGTQFWECKCECGQCCIKNGSYLRNGHTKSCGCLKSEITTKRSIKHNKSKTRLYRIWALMKDRCSNQKNKRYDNYGKRGIFYCSDWYTFEPFYNWAISNGYSEKLTIDRIDNNKGYYPENCRWVDMTVQANNTSRNHYVIYNNIKNTISQWMKFFNLNCRTFYNYQKKHPDKTDEQIIKRYYQIYINKKENK